MTCRGHQPWARGNNLCVDFRESHHPPQVTGNPPNRGHGIVDDVVYGAKWEEATRYLNGLARKAAAAGVDCQTAYSVIASPAAFVWYSDHEFVRLSRLGNATCK